MSLGPDTKQRTPSTTYNRGQGSAALDLGDKRVGCLWISQINSVKPFDAVGEAVRVLVRASGRVGDLIPLGGIVLDEFSTETSSAANDEDSFGRHGLFAFVSSR